MIHFRNKPVFSLNRAANNIYYDTRKRSAVGGKSRTIRVINRPDISWTSQVFKEWSATFV